ncbi:ABC-F type ribosomal protection protein [Staphylococcus sp. GSSP0090]|nr:ABC-F type ribosomal protection protein [Staphylococcus sp. GSSP0090]
MEQYTVKFNQVRHKLTDFRSLEINELHAYQFEKIALIGANGTGKTTILNMIHQTVTPDHGHIEVNEDDQYFEQLNMDIDSDYNQLDGEVLSEFKLSMKYTNVMSGGEIAKYKLSQIISDYRPILLLDEPTNHMDSNGIEYLINHLKYYYGTLILVSHNRYLIDKVVDTIWEIQNNGKIRVFKGNYSQYQEQIKLEEIEQKKEYEQYENEKRRLKKASVEKRKQAQKVNKVTDKQRNKSIKPDRYSASKQKDSVEKAVQKQAKHIEKRLEQLEKVEKPQVHQRFQFPQNKIYSIYNKYPIIAQDLTLMKSDITLLSHVRFQIPYGQNIAIIGENGVGKTSLFEAIYQYNACIDISPKVKMAYYRQLSYEEMKDVTLLNYLMEETDTTEAFARSILNNLGLNEALDRSCKILSGGERTKLSLAILFTTNANVLILDEPTNFLDIQTLEALELFMNAYPGIILFTSHDTAFVEQVADVKWEIREQSIYDVT